MRLADFILDNFESIRFEWEAFARSIRVGSTMNSLALRDHAEDILPGEGGRRVDKTCGRIQPDVLEPLQISPLASRHRPKGE